MQKNHPDMMKHIVIGKFHTWGSASSYMMWASHDGSWWCQRVPEALNMASMTSTVVTYNYYYKMTVNSINTTLLSLDPTIDCWCHVAGAAFHSRSTGVMWNVRQPRVNLLGAGLHLCFHSISLRLVVVVVTVNISWLSRTTMVIRR